MLLSEISGIFQIELLLVFSVLRFPIKIVSSPEQWNFKVPCYIKSHFMLIHYLFYNSVKINVNDFSVIYFQEFFQGFFSSFFWIESEKSFRINLNALKWNLTCTKSDKMSFLTFSIKRNSNFQQTNKGAVFRRNLRIANELNRLCH